VNTVSPLERAYRDGSNATTEDCTTTPKKTARAVKATTQKINQIKCHEVSILCLYLINLI